MVGKIVNLKRLVCVVPPCQKHEDQVIGVEAGRAGPGQPGQGPTGQGQPGQGKTEQGRAKQAGQGKPDPHEIYTVRGGQCKAGQDRASRIWQA